jgi:hypothetical protein
VVPTLRTTITTANPVTSSHYSQIPKPPLTDVLLQVTRITVLVFAGYVCNDQQL